LNLDSSLHKDNLLMRVELQGSWLPRSLLIKHKAHFHPYQQTQIMGMDINYTHQATLFQIYSNF
jgi:hypothetical protein